MKREVLSHKETHSIYFLPFLRKCKDSYIIYTLNRIAIENEIDSKVFIISYYGKTIEKNTFQIIIPFCLPDNVCRLYYKDTTKVTIKVNNL